MPGAYVQRFPQGPTPQLKGNKSQLAGFDRYRITMELDTTIWTENQHISGHVAPAMGESQRTKMMHLRVASVLTRWESKQAQTG
jgi:hypothetical protein